MPGIGRGANATRAAWRDAEGAPKIPKAAPKGSPKAKAPAANWQGERGGGWGNNRWNDAAPARNDAGLTFAPGVGRGAPAQRPAQARPPPQPTRVPVQPSAAAAKAPGVGVGRGAAATRAAWMPDGTAPNIPKLAKAPPPLPPAKEVPEVRQPQRDNQGWPNDGWSPEPKDDRWRSAEENRRPVEENHDQGWTTRPDPDPPRRQYDPRYESPPRDRRQAQGDHRRRDPSMSSSADSEPPRPPSSDRNRRRRADPPRRHYSPDNRHRGRRDDDSSPRLPREDKRRNAPSDDRRKKPTKRRGLRAFTSSEESECSSSSSSPPSHSKAKRRSPSPRPRRPLHEAGRPRESPKAMNNNRLLRNALNGTRNQPRPVANDRRDVVDLTSSIPLLDGQKRVVVRRGGVDEPWGISHTPYEFNGMDWSHKIEMIEPESPSWKSPLMIGDVILQAQSDPPSVTTRGALTGTALKVTLICQEARDVKESEWGPREVPDDDTHRSRHYEDFIFEEKFDNATDHKKYLESDRYRRELSRFKHWCAGEFGEEFVKASVHVYSALSYHGKGLLPFGMKNDDWGCWMCDMKFNSRSEMIEHMCDKRGIHALNRAMLRTCGLPLWTKFESPHPSKRPKWFFDLVSEQYITEHAEERYARAKEKAHRAIENELPDSLTEMPKWVEKLPANMDLSKMNVDEKGRLILYRSRRPRSAR